MNELPMQNANALAGLLTANTYGQEHLHRVHGIEGMGSFQTKPSSDYALFEENSDVFCVKATDQNNNPSYRYFAFSEISKEEAMQKISPYVMKGELESIKEDILTALRNEMSSFKEDVLNAQQLIRTKQTGAIKPYKSDSESADSSNF